MALEEHDLEDRKREMYFSGRVGALLDRLNFTPSSVFIKSTQLEITVSAVFSWKTLISYIIFIIT